MTANDVYVNLNTLFWVKPIVRYFFPFTEKMTTPPSAVLHREVTIRIPTDEKTRFGKPKPQRRRFDVVGIVKPHYKAWEERFSVGFEIKVALGDLRADTKIQDYLTYTDLFFLAVPTALLPAAEEIIINGQWAKHIGLIDAQQQRIIRLPNFVTCPSNNHAELYRELAFRALL